MALFWWYELPSWKARVERSKEEVTRRGTRKGISRRWRGKAVTREWITLPDDHRPSIHRTRSDTYAHVPASRRNGITRGLIWSTKPTAVETATDWFVASVLSPQCRLVGRSVVVVSAIICPFSSSTDLSRGHGPLFLETRSASECHPGIYQEP